MRSYVVFVWLLLAGTGVCIAQPANEHPDPAKKAMVNELSEWNESFWQYYENGEYDKAYSFYSPNVVFIVNNEVVKRERLKEMQKNWEGRKTQFNITVDSTRVQCLGNGHAAITSFAFAENSDTSGGPYYARFNYVMVVERKADDWQINSFHEHTHSTPLLFHTDLPTEWCKGEASESTKFFVTLFHMYHFLFQDLAYFKEEGVPVEDRANALADSYLKTWRDDITFEKLCQYTLRNMQSFTSKCELVARDENHLKIRNYKVYRSVIPETLTDAEVVRFFEILNGAVADKFGIEYAMVDEGDYFTQTFTKKE